MGVFRPVDEKPAFTLSFAKYEGATRFHGLKRLHLNNAREDSTFLRQLVCGEMARAAGVPASRCTHALVSLNGRKLGLYVLVEGYTQDFLAQFFAQTEGDLYEGGFCKDIDAELTKDEGDVRDFRIIEQLIAATREEDDAKRWKALQGALDVDRYASFLAMESLMGVGDGYDFFRNNYRIYHDPVTKRLAFILHAWISRWVTWSFRFRNNREHGGAGVCRVR
jgi:spore coat protein CotH